MTNNEQDYDIATIRKLLLAAFTAEELYRLLLYSSDPDLRPLTDEFSSSDGLTEMVDRTIIYCEKRLLLPALLSEVAQANPRQYARFEPRLRMSEPAPAHPPPSPRAWPSWYWMVAGLLLILVVGIVGIGARLLLWPGPASTPETTYAGDTWTRPTDGAVMVYVPAGEFLMGSTDDDPEAYDDEKPQHTVYLDAFWIDRTEVTNAQYRKCVEAGACEEPRCWDEPDFSAPDQPVVCVDWEDAKSYAAWVGGRLPTEAEWEKAARGTDGRRYPWGGSAPDCYKANYWGCGDRPLPVGSHPDGASPYGALDMAGNVWEWVADWWGEDYYAGSPFRNPHGPASGDSRVLRGGAFGFDQGDVRCACRAGLNPAYANGDYGFRVVVAPGPSGD